MRDIAAPRRVGDPCVKGAGFRSLLQSLAKLHGPSATFALPDECPSDLAEALRFRRIVSSGWYSMAWYREIHRAAQRVTKTGSDLAQQLGYTATQSDFKGIYRVFLLVISPHVMLQNAPRIFRTYYSHGEMRIESARGASAVARFEGCTAFDHNVWQDVFGSCRAALELAGAKNLRLHVAKGGGDEDDSADLEAYWT